MTKRGIFRLFRRSSIFIDTDTHPDTGFPPVAKEGQKRLDIFFAGMLIRIALNEYSFIMAGGGR
jgi:hypothetical protein